VKIEDSYLGMLHDDHYRYSEYSYYGSQVYVPAASPGPSTVQFVHPYVNRPNTHPYTTGLFKLKAAKTRAKIQELTRGKRGKGPKKQAAKYDSFEPEEERYLVNLWVSYHERLESKHARKYWSKIVDELKAKYNYNRN